MVDHLKTMRITDLTGENQGLLLQTAVILYDSFKDVSGWPNQRAALDEVQESLGPDRISRIAVNEQETVLGWIGGKSMYNGNVWELHPLVVKQEFRSQGIGKALVTDLEAQVKKRGGLTIWLGTDDEDNSTTLSDTDLYESLYEKITKIRNLKRHPYEFYQKLGFMIVGVMPDANGIGKPDIYMAKKIRK